jgi:hypothetical protein
MEKPAWQTKCTSSKTLTSAARNAGLNPMIVEVDPNTGRIKVTSGATVPASEADPWKQAVADLEAKAS